MSVTKLTNLNDRTPFWGAKTCNEFKYLQLVLNNKISDINFSRSCYRELLKTILIATEELNNEESLNQITVKLEDLSKQFKISLHNLSKIYTSLLKLFKSAIRLSSIKQDVIKEDLIDFLKFPNEMTSDFATVLYSHKREDIEYSLANFYPQHVTLKSINWRIDVSISSSSISKGLVPTISIQMILSNDQIVSFEMNLNSFHLLRYNVALVLKEMDDLLNRPTFK